MVKTYIINCVWKTKSTLTKYRCPFRSHSSIPRATFSVVNCNAVWRFSWLRIQASVSFHVFRLRLQICTFRASLHEPGSTLTRVSSASNFTFTRARTGWGLGRSRLTRVVSSFARLKGLVTTCQWGNGGRAMQSSESSICVNVISHFTNVIWLYAAACIIRCSVIEWFHCQVDVLFSTRSFCSFACAILLQAAHGQERWTAKTVTFKRSRVR